MQTPRPSPPQLDHLPRLPDGSLELTSDGLDAVVNVEPLGRHDAAVPHQMDEEAVQWFDPQEGVWDGPEAVGDQ